MLLNRNETLLMNNPIRAAVHRYVEARMLRRLGGPAPGATALEVGCGRGLGGELILDVFQAARVDCLDLDPRMVELAARHLAPWGDRASVGVGDVTELAADDDTYDAVFDFGIIHHVPDWRAALREVYRVLSPGGRLYAEEVLKHFILHPLARRLLDHPTHDRFDFEGFGEALVDTGFSLHAGMQVGGLFGWFVADKF